MKALLALKNLPPKSHPSVTGTAVTLGFVLWAAGPEHPIQFAVAALALSGLLTKLGALALSLFADAARALGAFVAEAVRTARSNLGYFFGMWLTDRAARRGRLSAWDRSHILRRLHYRHILGEEPPAATAMPDAGLRADSRPLGRESPTPADLSHPGPPGTMRTARVLTGGEGK